MRFVRILTLVSVIAGCVAAYGSGAFAASAKVLREDYIREPMPAGVQVVNTELEGNVFADAQGRTIYRWPVQFLRNGGAGDNVGKPTCFNTPTRETVGYTSPYPAGNLLPDADHHPTCTQHWPPFAAAADAKPVGKWTIISRSDGIKQWAYRGYPLYTSHLDHLPGETNGGSYRKVRDAPSGGAPREPVAPMPLVPVEMKAQSMALGRMLQTTKGASVYVSDKDKANKSNCTGDCADTWPPILAPEFAVSQGEWTVIQRQDGKRQWAYRGQPLYTHAADTRNRSYEGSDVPGWHNVFTQPAPPMPAGWGYADTRGGLVRTDAHGRTVYFYSCNEDTLDTLYCDSPDMPQEYRLAMCGGGDVTRCLKTFPYVIAEASAKSESVSWSVRDINPMTGRYVAAGTPGSLHIWAYRGRPLYYFAGDEVKGDIEGDSWGQDHGVRNGFQAFWVRDDFRGELDGAGRGN